LFTPLGVDTAQQANSRQKSSELSEGKKVRLTILPDKPAAAIPHTYIILKKSFILFQLIFIFS